MAQDSGFWDDGVGGDDLSATLWQSPYADIERADFFSAIFGSDQARAWVVPGMGDDLAVSENSPAGMSVLVGTGRVFVRGFIYGNTAEEELTIAAADGANPRIDLVCLQISFAAQTIRLVVKTGTPAGTPSYPALTQNAATYEIALAEVFVKAATATIEDEEIHDLREFAPNFYHLLSGVRAENLVPDSELFGAYAFTSPFWTYTTPGGPGNSTSAWSSTRTMPPKQHRGKILVLDPVTAATDYYQSHTIPVKASTVYTLKAYLKVYTANTSGLSFSVITDGASPLTVTKRYYRIGEWEECQIQFTTPADATEVYFEFKTLGDTFEANLGQVLMSEGYDAGPFREIHEFVVPPASFPDTSWAGTAKSTGSTTIDLDTDFAAQVRPGVTSVMLRIEGRDSGSAGAADGTCYFRVSSGLSAILNLQIAGAVNDMEWATHGPIGVVAGRQFVFQIGATGVGTFDATAYVIGLWT